MQLALLIALYVTVAVLGAGVVAVREATRQGTRDSKRMLEREARAQAFAVGMWVGDQAQAIRSWTEVYPLDHLDDEKRVSLLRSVFVAVPSIVTVALVDADGVPVVDPIFLDTPPNPHGSLGGRAVGSKLGARTLVDKLPLSEVLDPANERRTFIGEPYTLPGEEVVSIPVAVPSASSTAPLVLGAELSMAPLTVLLEAGTDPATVALLDGQGRAIYGGDAPLVDEAQLRPFLRVEGWVEYTTNGQAVMSATAAIPNTDWTVVVVQPTQVVRRSANRVRSQVGLVLAAAILLVMVGAAFVAVGYTRQIDALVLAVRRVADGDFGRQTEVVAQAPADLVELTQALNEMSSRLEQNRLRLQAQQSEIQRFNAELQERVDARTRELRDAQAHLVRSGQLAAVAEMGAGLAHELNNPLAGILGTAQLLGARHEDPSVRSAVSTIEEQAARCREVVGQMLRLAQRDVDLESATVVDLQEVLGDVASLVRGPFRQRGVELSLENTNTNLPIHADFVHASRIFAQILNAIRAGLNDGATLSVQGEVRGDEVVVTFASDQSDLSKDDYLASSMGLWVSRQLLDDMGGRLEDPEEGQAVWRVFLPVGSPG